MKKTVYTSAFTLLFALTFLSLSQNAGAAAEPDMYSDIPLVSEGFNYHIRPYAHGEGYVAMLPLSAVLYEYADIEFDESEGIVYVTCGTLDVEFTLGETDYVINAERGELDAAPEIIDGLVYVPATFFEKTFGFWTTDNGDGYMDLFMPSLIIDNI